jgi:TPR repeat protein
MLRRGLAHLHGADGATKDAKAAKAWLLESAELGHPRAQATLGRMAYDEMEALRSLAQAQDYQALAEAHKWLTRASAQGQLDATRTLIPLFVVKGDLAAAIRSTFVWMRQRLLP